MALIETVKQMQQQGMNDLDISQKLQEQGANPKEIEDAINQSRIKAAVSETYETSGQESIINNSEMQQSIMTQAPQVPQSSQAEQPQTQEYVYPTEQYQQPYAGEYYQPQQQMASETMTEIAEQIVSEKISDIKKALSSIADFKTITEAKLSGMDSRLKKIESIIDKLQLSILGKVGEYGQAIEDVKSEITSMEESFSKVINPLFEKSREAIREQKPKEQHQIHQKQQTHQTQERKAKKSKDGFESYLSR